MTNNFVLPPRGTGLRMSTAGARKGGKPRTEEERKKRHQRMLKILSSKFQKSK